MHGCANQDKSQSAVWQRHEAKYLINDELADRIRGYCRAHLPLDPHSAVRPNHQYPIHSVYLDSPSAYLLRGTVDRRVDRFKLRVRTYRDHWQAGDGLPVFSEVKRKTYGLVRKWRARLTRLQADSVLWHRRLVCGGDTRRGSVTFDNVAEFLRLRESVQAEPVMAVHYTREAYETQGIDGVRINLDRNLRYGLLADGRGGLQELWSRVPLKGVILEVKFTNTFPFWIRHLIGRSDLTRRGVCKYLLCTLAARGVSLEGTSYHPC